MIRERKLYLLTLVSFVAAATKSNFEVHETYNADELHLRLTFDDKSFDDHLILHRFYFNENDRLTTEKAKCRFIGHLASDPKASVALTGCLKEEDVMITILARDSPFRKMFWLKLNGEIEEIQSVSYYSYILENRINI